MSQRYVAIDNTIWPIPGDAEWVLRYGTESAREHQRVFVASVVGAYSALTDPDLSQKDALAMLKRARASRVESLQDKEASDDG